VFSGLWRAGCEAIEAPAGDELMRFPGVGYAPTPVNNACELSVSIEPA